MFDDNKEDFITLVPAMDALEGATSESMSTHFPPEPSGYLCVDHAKAVLLSGMVYRTRPKIRIKKIKKKIIIEKSKLYY